MAKEQVNILQVSDLLAGSMPSMGKVVIRLNSHNDPAQVYLGAVKGRTYSLTPAQGRELISQMTLALAVLDISMRLEDGPQLH